MRLADTTDYTLRVLMYCAARPGRQITIGEIAIHHDVSKNHLMKIVNALARQGILETTRGRGGGLRLRMQPADIRVGDVVRSSETDFRLAECFDSRTDACSLTPTCRLKGVFHAALQAYFKELDGATLADIVGPVATTCGSATGARGARTMAPATTPVHGPLTRGRVTAERSS